MFKITTNHFFWNKQRYKSVGWIFLKIQRSSTSKCFEATVHTYIYINVRENRLDNQEWTIQRNWQLWYTIVDTGRRQTKQKTLHRKLKKMSKTNPNHYKSVGFLFPLISLSSSSFFFFFFFYLFFMNSNWNYDLLTVWKKYNILLNHIRKNIDISNNKPTVICLFLLRTNFSNVC